MVDDLTGPQIASFLDEHVREMPSITPPESKHALDLATLRKPGITFWSVMDGAESDDQPGFARHPAGEIVGWERATE